MSGRGAPRKRGGCPWTSPDQDRAGAGAPFSPSGCYAGLRKGELAGLRKTDIHLHYGTITVQRSYNRDTTKGGHADTIPVAAELVPYLEDAMAQSRSDLVLPGKRGKMRPPGEQLQLVLRRALRRAGICRGYQHKCRFKGCGLVEVHDDAEPRRCPKHRHLMWPVGIVPDIRFHDLRHTTGSLLAMTGVDTPALQRILRHRDPWLTMSTYVHLTPASAGPRHEAHARQAPLARLHRDHPFG